MLGVHFLKILWGICFADDQNSFILNIMTEGNFHKTLVSCYGNDIVVVVELPFRLVVGFLAKENGQILSPLFFKQICFLRKAVHFVCDIVLNVKKKRALNLVGSVLSLMFQQRQFFYDFVGNFCWLVNEFFVYLQWVLFTPHLIPLYVWHLWFSEVLGVHSSDDIVWGSIEKKILLWRVSPSYSRGCFGLIEFILCFADPWVPLSPSFFIPSPLLLLDSLLFPPFLLPFPFFLLHFHIL